MCSCRSCLAHVDFVWFVQISVNSIRTHVFKSALVDEIFRYAKFIPELFQRNSREMSARDADFDSKYVVTCGQRFVPAQFRNLFLMRFLLLSHSRGVNTCQRDGSCAGFAMRTPILGIKYLLRAGIWYGIIYSRITSSCGCFSVTTK